jgi:hypothetical protein
VFTFLNVPQENVEEKMGEMFVGIWTQLMQSPQVAFVDMPRIVGVMKRLRQQMARMIWKVPARSWLRQSCVMAQLQPSSNVSEKEK